MNTKIQANVEKLRELESYRKMLLVQIASNEQLLEELNAQWVKSSKLPLHKRILEQMELRVMLRKLSKANAETLLMEQEARLLQKSIKQDILK